ncbi:MAG TPA: adenosylmethionine decarboxylase [Candidatus Eisenbacteria bacterium]
MKAADETSGFGPHLMLDGYGCDKAKLEDLNLIYRILEELPDRIGMTRIMPPYVFKYSGLRAEDWGISGFVLIAESHISIHTFPEKNFVSVDIFSCKPFDADFASHYLKTAFEMAKVESKVLDRGTEFPKELDGAAQLVREERRRISRPVVSRQA